MNPGVPDPRARLLRRLRIGTIVFALLGFQFLLWNLTRPYPIQCRENADVFGSLLLLQGKNPYGPAEQPAFAYLYGIVHSLIAAPFVSLFGHPFQVHRALSGLYLVLASVVLVWGMRVSRVSRPLAAAGGLFFFGHLAFSLAISSKPDALGLLLLILSTVVPYAFGFRGGSLAAAGIFSIVAFYTKPYFLIGSPLLALYLFLFHSKRRGLLFGFLFLAAFGLGAVEVDRLLPLYFPEVVFSNLRSAGHSWLHLFWILKDYFPAGVCLVAVAVWSLARRPHGGADGPLWPPRWNFFRPGEPLLHQPSLGWVGFLLLATSALYLLKMGPDGVGNGVDYIYHLVLPFLIWRAFVIVGVEAPEERRPLWLLTAAVFLTIGFVALPSLVKRERNYARQWSQTEQSLAKYHDVLEVRPFAGIAWKQGKPVYDTGQTDVFSLTFPAADPTAAEAGYQQQWNDYLAAIAQKVRDKKFDAVLVFREGSPLLPPDLLPRTYHKVESFRIRMTFMSYWVDLWEPLPSTSGQ